MSCIFLVCYGCDFVPATCSHDTSRLHTLPPPPPQPQCVLYVISYVHPARNETPFVLESVHLSYMCHILNWVILEPIRLQKTAISSREKLLYLTKSSKRANLNPTRILHQSIPAEPIPPSPSQTLVAHFFT